MKKKILIIISVLLIGSIILFSGLQNNTEKVNIIGSTSVQPVAEKLVESYEKTHNIDINVQGGGSSVGIKSVQDGTADIGTSSKELSNDEKKGLTEYELGKDGIVVAVNNKNPIKNLSKKQLKDIFSGEITNWKEVGGKDSKINIISRESGSGTLDAFNSIVMEDSIIKSDAIVQSSTEAVKQSVKQDENAIGFISFAHMSDDVKSINVNNIEPTTKTIADGSYELQRPFLFLIKGTPSKEIKEFLDWIDSPEGQKILDEEKIIK